MTDGGPGSSWRATPADPGALFDAAELERSRAYQRPVRRVRVARTVGRAVVLVLAVPLAAAVVDSLDRGWVVQLLVVLALVEALVAMVDGPAEVWLDLVHDRRWGLSTRTAAGTGRDVLAGTLVSYVLGATLLVPVYALARTTSWWWLWAWLVVLAWTVVTGLVLPGLVAPRFVRLTPAGPEVAARVAAVAERAGVAVGRVVVADESRRSRRDDAHVDGLGPTRRVVLGDDLLATPPELVDQVVAHELGHVRRHHVARQVPVVAAVALVGLVTLAGMTSSGVLLDAVGLEGPGDPAGLPVAVLLVGVLGSVAGLVPAWVSRAFERQADLDALELLGRPDRVEAVLRRLHLGNLADLDPGRLDRWRASHPPVAERIAAARRWRASPDVRSARGG